MPGQSENENALAKLLVEALNLEDVAPDEIEPQREIDRTLRADAVDRVTRLLQPHESAEKSVEPLLR